MRTKLLTTFAIASAIFMTGCKDDDPKPNKSVIPVQTVTMEAVSLASSSNLAVLAGSAVTSTGATVITGDMALSPGTSIGGFPPGILNGTQHINDASANQG